MNEKMNHKATELNEQDLEKVFGGILTNEAKDWVTRNKSAVVARAGALGGLADYALGLVEADKTVYDVDMLKAKLKNFGVDADDLN